MRHTIPYRPLIANDQMMTPLHRHVKRHSHGRRKRDPIKLNGSNRNTYAEPPVSGSPDFSA
jgi:hypothetical protein